MVIRASDNSTIANIVLDLCSLIWGFGKSCAVVHGITFQLANVFSISQMCHIDIFVDL